MDQGRVHRLDEALLLFEEDLAASRETLGNRHPETCRIAVGLFQLLRAKGGCDDEMAQLDQLHGIWAHSLM